MFTPECYDCSAFTGTDLFFEPGLLLGGTLEHVCSQQRSIGYFLEPLCMLAPFAKKPIRITLKGITNGPDDPSVSWWSFLLYSMCPVTGGKDYGVKHMGGV